MVNDYNSSLTFQGYPRDILDCIPIKSLLSYVEKNDRNYKDIHPPLVRMITNAFPQLFDLTNLLYEEEQNSRYEPKLTVSKRVSARLNSLCNTPNLEICPRILQPQLTRKSGSPLKMLLKNPWKQLWFWTNYQRCYLPSCGRTFLFSWRI